MRRRCEAILVALFPVVVQRTSSLRVPNCGSSPSLIHLSSWASETDGRTSISIPAWQYSTDIIFYHTARAHVLEWHAFFFMESHSVWSGCAVRSRHVAHSGRACPCGHAGPFLFRNGSGSTCSSRNLLVLRPRFHEACKFSGSFPKIPKCKCHC